jgi:ABC-type transport system involved in multi-copper enzyme maturation permease subunit
MMRTLYAEWTKFRTARGWVIGLLAAIGAIVLLGVLPGAQGTCGTNGPGSECALPVGPSGDEVTDTFTLVHQSLIGNGTITARIVDFTGEVPHFSDDITAPPTTKEALAPWAKAGLIVKDGTRGGSTYAALFLTGGHGLRLQYDYVGDEPSTISSDARWLRLTRDGQTITAYASIDGTQWTWVGDVELPDLPGTAEVGLVVTSPQYAEVASLGIIQSGATGGPTTATATFDHLSLADGWSAGPWQTTKQGPDQRGEMRPSGAQPTADGFQITGTGDIAPAVVGANGLGFSLTQTLAGTFLGLILVIVIATMSITAEYRRGLIRTTVTATPRRGRVLAAKAAVLAGTTWVVGAIGAAIVVLVGQNVLRANGVYVHAASTATEVRLVLGTATLLAVAAVLALAIGTLQRKSAIAVTIALVGIVLPYLLAISVLPASAAQWVLRITPAAAFSVQQSAPEWPQVDNLYTAVNGYFPLSPWGGLGVLVLWTVVLFGLAQWTFRRRDV